MNSKEVTRKIIEILKKVDEKDYSCMAEMFGNEKACIKYLQNSAYKHPDMIIELLKGIKKKTEDELIKTEINELMKCISQ